MKERIEHSVRWISDTHLVKVGKWMVPRVSITGNYFIRSGEWEERKKNGISDTGDGSSPSCS